MFSILHSLGGEGWGCFAFYAVPGGDAWGCLFFYTAPGEEGRERLVFYAFSGEVFFILLPNNFK